MADEKPVTKSDLVSALKEAGIATKEDVRDIVHEELTEFHASMTAPKLEELRGDMKIGFRHVKSRLDKLELETRHVKDEIKGLKADLSNTPSREQFEKLKAKVDKYHPIS